MKHFQFKTNPQQLFAENLFQSTENSSTHKPFLLEIQVQSNVV